MEAKVIFLLSLCFIQVLCDERPAYQPEYKEPGRPYSYSYGIKDAYTGVDIDQEEQSDGNEVSGSYSVQLPDGRKQFVTYIANHIDGYQAEVNYEGEAIYPAPSNSAPVEYKPAPVEYKPDPAEILQAPQLEEVHEE